MDDLLPALAARLAAVDGVVGVVLGGSRARGTHRPDSDYDLGLYYRDTLDVAALRTLAAEVDDTAAASSGPGGAGGPDGGAPEVTEPGGWGPWVDGGAWLTVGGRRVDWIYRDLDRVERIWADCRRGRYEIGFQPGHPLGFYSHAYAGELALCRVLEDPSGTLHPLREATTSYPPALRAALVAGLWEADFALRIADYGAAGEDSAYAAGCLFRAAGVLCHALHADAGRWLVNEKGMVAAAGRLPGAPPGFTGELQRLLGSVGTSGAAIQRTIASMRALTGAVRRKIDGAP